MYIQSLRQDEVGAGGFYVFHVCDTIRLTVTSNPISKPLEESVFPVDSCLKGFSLSGNLHAAHSGQSWAYSSLQVSSQMYSWSSLWRSNLNVYSRSLRVGCRTHKLKILNKAYVLVVSNAKYLIWSCSFLRCHVERKYTWDKKLN